MDNLEALESIAKILPNLLPDAVESMLLTFDTLAGLSGAACRPDAAKLMRGVAVLCDDARKQRLFAAAASVEAGQPCALTPDGLTWAQAAAAQTVTADQWQAMPADQPPEAPPDSDDPPEIMEQEPPRLPQLHVRHFFPGLVVRARQEIVDASGRGVVAGQLLHLLTSEQVGGDGGYTLHFLERSLRLNAKEILENIGNMWFQPVPSVECLENLFESIDSHLSAFDDSDEDDDDDESMEAIREDFASCQDWLMRERDRSPAPVCKSGRLAAQVFGRDRPMAAWFQLLFAAIARCKPD